MIPASIRNNNPGAQYPGPSAKKFGGTSFETLKSKDGTHKIATFPTSVHGAAAMFDLLANGRRTGGYLYRDKPIHKAIEMWCGGFYANTYIKVLEEKGGIKSTDILTEALIRDPRVAIPLAKAMAWQEAGRDYPMDDAEWLEAHALAFGKAEAPEWNPRNDVPTPKPETRRAILVKQVQKGVAVVGGSITAGGAAVKTLTDTPIPAPPAGVTETLVNLGAWGKLLPSGQVGMLAVGAGVFAGVALASWGIGKLWS